MTLRKIISGGQTGADRAALDAALHLGFPCGGWCPEGRKAEDGPLPLSYPLEVLPGAGYRKRTIRNIEESDATAVFCFGVPLGGTALTLAQCQRLGKAHQVIDAAAVAPARAAAILQAFVGRHEVGVLNVAGPSEERTPGSYAYVRGVVAILVESAMGGTGRETGEVPEKVSK